MDSQGKATLAVVGGVLVVGAGAGIYFLTKGKKASLVGAVVSGVDGTAIAGASVSVQGKNAVTDSVGMFTILGLPIGEVSVSITATGFIPYTTPVTLIEGANPKRFQLFKTVTQAGLTGVVTDINTGAPLAGVQVAVSGKSATTVADGTYSITGLVAGTVSATFTKQWYVTKSVNKTLLAGANTQDMAMNNLGSISGGIIDRDYGNAIGGATVSCAGRSTQSTPAGVYILTGVPGGPQTVNIAKTGYVVQNQPVTVLAEQTVNLDIELVQQYEQKGTVQGLARDSQSQAGIAGAVITFNPGGYIVTSGFGGGYSIELPTGPYTITAVKSGYYNYSGSQTVATGGVHNKNIIMEPVPVAPGRITGQVVDNATGFAISGVRIDLEPTDQYAYTGADGTFTIENVPPTDYTIYAYKQDWSQVFQLITVVSGQTAIASFGLDYLSPSLGFTMTPWTDEFPTAQAWYMEIVDSFGNTKAFHFGVLGVDWDFPNDITGWSGPLSIHCELWSADFYEKLWPPPGNTGTITVPGVLGPMMQNGHAYQFWINYGGYTARLVDTGTF